MKRDVEQFFKPPRQAGGWYSQPFEKQIAMTVTEGHDRLEKRPLSCIADETGFFN